MRRIGALAAAIAAALALVAGSAPAARATGTLHGVLTIGPTQPVCREGEPCTKPAAGATISFRRGGEIVRRVRTDAQGRYRVRLRAGVYAVRTSVGLPGSVPDPARVRVVAGTTRRVDLFADTGIR